MLNHKIEARGIVRFKETARRSRIEHTFSEFGDERSTNAVELAVSRLRKKLEAHPTGSSIETIRGVGYMMREVRV